MRYQIILDLRRAGIICFVIGVIIFFGWGDTSWGLVYLSSSIAPENQLTDIMISGGFLIVWNGAIILILAGAVIFIVARRNERAHPPAAT